MKYGYSLKIASTLCALFAISSCHASGKYEKFVDSLSCGNVSYTIVSLCEKPDDEMSLRECKPQKLTSRSNGVNKSVVLPELDENERKSLIAAGGALEDLFVVEWACTTIKGRSIAVMHYSIGGGSAPYSEAWSKYDGGKLKSDAVLPFDKTTFPALKKNLKKVHSIMPN